MKGKRVARRDRWLGHTSPLVATLWIESCSLRVLRVLRGSDSDL